jgi:hypothetical protein
MGYKCKDHNKPVCIACGHNTCVHRRNKYSCKVCNRDLICQHEKYRKICKLCSPENFCEHGRVGYNCKVCKGPGICEHGKRKNYCKDCKGPGICQHGREKYRCIDCGGAGICKHRIQRSLCADCGGGGICQHKKVRRSCHVCRKKPANAQQQGEQQEHEANLDDIDRFNAYMQQSMQNPIAFPNLFITGNADNPFIAPAADYNPPGADNPFIAPAADYNPPGYNSGESFNADDEGFNADNEGGSTGKRKRRRFTRRLPRKYNHTKKKSKLAKRKVTKRLRKNKI